MDQYDRVPPPLPSDVPPIEPSDELAEFVEPPKWPKVVGIISIVWGSLNLGCGGCGIVWGVVAPGIMKQQEAQTGYPSPPGTIPQPLDMGLYGFSILVAALLIVAGGMCVARSALARPAHMVYAVLSIIVLAASFIIAYTVTQPAMNAYVQQYPDSPGAQQQKMMGPAIQILIQVAIGLIAIAWPVFCLIWFGLVKKRHEDMTGGIEQVA